MGKGEYRPPLIRTGCVACRERMGRSLGLSSQGKKKLVVDGPRCGDGYAWWLIRSLEGLEGWSAEGDPTAYWLVPSYSVQGTWQQQFPTNAPSPRKGMGMVYDTRRHVVVATGGTDWETTWGETWEFNGDNWKLRQDVNHIPHRTGAAMAYDSQRQFVVLFGGSGPGDDVFYEDTWEYNGKTWVQVQTRHAPPARNGAAMAFDPQGERMLLFGGYDRFASPAFLDDTWEYVDGDGGSFSPI